MLFEQRTGLTRIVLHELGQYPKLLRWIEDDRRGRGKPLRTAARDWYARIYLPTVARLQARRLLRYFPGRSLGDLFVYLGDHKWIMSRAAGRDVGIQVAVDSFAAYLEGSHRSGAFARWLGGLARAIHGPRPRARPKASED